MHLDSAEVGTSRRAGRWHGCGARGRSPAVFIVLAAHYLPSQRSQGYIAQKKRVAHIESLIRERPRIGVNALFGERPNILPGPVELVGMADRGESQSEATGKLRGLTDILEKIDERSGERTCQNFRLAWFCTRLSHSRVLPDGLPTTFLAAPHGSYRVLPDSGPGFFLLACCSFLALRCAAEVRPCAALGEALWYCEYALPPSKRHVL